MIDTRERLARAVLLFWSAGEWSAARRAEWLELTGSKEATTKVLGDLAREVLGEAKPSQSGASSGDSEPSSLG